MSMPAFRNLRRPLAAGFLLLVMAGSALLGFYARNASPRRQQQTSLPSRQELMRQLFAQQRLHIVYSGAQQAIRQGYESFYREHAGRRRIKITAFADRDFALDSLGAAPLRLVGALSSNRALQALLPQLPVESNEEGFVFAGRSYRDSTDVLQLFYPNPRNPAMPLWITTGNSDAAILEHLKKSGTRFGDIGDYWTASRGQMQVIGFFQETAGPAWRTETAQEMNLAAEQRIAAVTPNFVIITHGTAFAQKQIDAFAEQEEASLAALLQRLQLPAAKLARTLPLRVHLWDSFEKKALFTRNADLRHLDAPRREAHLIWTETARGDDFFAEALWFIEQVLPQTASRALREGLAVACTRQWRGHGFEGWTARMLATGNAMAIEELFDPAIWRAESPLARQPLLGSLAAFLLNHYTAAEFERLYQDWPESGLPEKFPRGESWPQIKQLCHEQARQVPPAPLRHARAPEISRHDFHRGFCYAHEGYQVYNGYMGHRSRAALQALRAAGGDAISVTPFGYLQSTQRPDFLQRSDGLGAENDESLLATLQFARALGMRVMLKPHLWVGGSPSGWPGDIQMNSAQEWHKFLSYYERWLRHYALLAELYDFDSLCLGVEMVHATRGHETQWRAMIHRMRGLYSGPMVYAANWGEEFERLNFWNELDAIALNCYYPLSEKENARDAELLAGANQIADKVAAVARKYQKSVLLTEIGFCSRPGAWVQPHRDERRAPVDEESQRRCYEAIYKAFSGREWLAGIYWWKWPTDLSDGGPQDNQFTPNGKAAEQVVARWYKAAEKLTAPGNH